MKNMKDKNIIRDNLYDLYDSYNQHKLLFEFWKQNHTIKTKKEMKDRIDYIIKNKIKQRNEIETLLWVIGEDDDETTYN